MAFGGFFGFSRGTVIGIFLLDLLTRKGGEAGLEKMMSRKRFDHWKKMSFVG
jgi:hypothetical protein